MPSDEKTTITNSVIRKPNTHDFYEYMTSPEVSDTLLRFIYGINVSQSNYDKGVAEFKQGGLSGEVAKLRQKIDAVRSNPSITSLDTAIKQFKSLQTIVKKMEL